MLDNEKEQKQDEIDSNQANNEDENRLDQEAAEIDRLLSEALTVMNTDTHSATRLLADIQGKLIGNVSLRSKFPSLLVKLYNAQQSLNSIEITNNIDSHEQLRRAELEHVYGQMLIAMSQEYESFHTEEERNLISQIDKNLRNSKAEAEEVQARHDILKLKEAQLREYKEKHKEVAEILDKKDNLLVGEYANLKKYKKIEKYIKTIDIVDKEGVNDESIKKLEKLERDYAAEKDKLKAKVVLYIKDPSKTKSKEEQKLFAEQKDEIKKIYEELKSREEEFKGIKSVCKEPLKVIVMQRRSGEINSLNDDELNNIKDYYEAASNLKKIEIIKNINFNDKSSIANAQIQLKQLEEKYTQKIKDFSTSKSEESITKKDVSIEKDTTTPEKIAIAEARKIGQALKGKIKVSFEVKDNKNNYIPNAKKPNKDKDNDKGPTR